MRELVDAVVERTGISEEKAKRAVEVVISQLEKRMPAPLASQVRSFANGDLAGRGDSESQSVGDMAAGIGGMLRQK